MRRHPNQIFHWQTTGNRLWQTGTYPVLVLTILCCLTGCSGLFDHETISPTPVRISDGQNMSYGLIYIAAAKGYFQEEGLIPRFHHAPAGVQALDDLIEGQADFAGTYLTPVLAQILKGQDLAILSTIHRSDHYIGLIARRDRGIHQISDLASKRIAITPGTTSDFFLGLLARSNGLDPARLIKVPLTTTEIAGHLVKGDIDGGVLWGPFMARAQTLPDLPTETFFCDIFSESSVLVFRRDQNIPLRTQRKVLKAILKAQDFFRKNPDEALELVLRQLPAADAEANRRLWPRLSLLARLDNVLLTALENEGRWLIETQKIGTKVPDFHHFLQRQALESLDPLAVTVQ